MSVNKIPMKERLKRLQTGYASDPEFIISSIRAMADIPVRVYLISFPAEQQRLWELLNISEQKQETITYKKAAKYIKTIWLSQPNEIIAAEVIYQLAALLRKCYEERKTAYAGNTEGTT